MCLQEMTNPVLEDAELEAGIAEQVANAKAILGAFPPSAPLQSPRNSLMHTLHCRFLPALAAKVYAAGVLLHNAWCKA